VSLGQLAFAAQRPQRSMSLDLEARTLGQAFWLAWSERAAIMEFDGGMERPQAERAAWVSTRAALKLEEPSGRKVVYGPRDRRDSP